jgi:outer membrane protein TolC
MHRGLSFCLLVLAGCSADPAVRSQVSALTPLDPALAAAQAHEDEAWRGPAPAPPFDLPQPLTLDACIAAAVERNRGFRKQISALERKRLSVVTATATLDAPKLKGEAKRAITDINGTAKAGSDRTDSAEATLSVEQRLAGFSIAPYATQGFSQTDGAGATPYTSTVGLSISRSLLNGSAALNQRKDLTAAERSYLNEARNLRLYLRILCRDAAKAFLDLQLAEARLQLRERRLEESRASAQAVREAVAAGLKAQLEATNAAIDLNQAELDLLSDQTAVANKREDLRSLLDLPLAGAIALSPTVLADTVPDLPAMEQDLERVLAGHEDLAKLATDLDGALENARISRDTVQPQLTGTLAASRAWKGPNPGEGDERDDRVSLTLTYEMPLDGWTGQRAAWHNALRSVRETRIDLAAKRVELEAQVRDLHRNLAQLVRQVQLAATRVEAEQAKYRATEINWTTGRVDNLELTRARQDVGQAEVALLEARINLAKARADREALLPPQP